MNIQEESKAIVASGADVLIAAGGDGTINAAASALVHQRTALGVIPAGTLNHFARDLEIPLDPEEAAQVLVGGRIIQVDAAAVNGRVFINNSVLGLFPKYRVAREAWERHGFGSTRVGRFIATVAAVLKVFWRLPHLIVSLDVEGQRRTLRTPFVLVGNNEHRMEGLALGKRTRLDAGALWVYVMRPCSRWQFAAHDCGSNHWPCPARRYFRNLPCVAFDHRFQAASDWCRHRWRDGAHARPSALRMLAWRAAGCRAGFLPVFT